jgi:hypothetical protein
MVSRRCLLDRVIRRLVLLVGADDGGRSAFGGRFGSSASWMNDASLVMRGSSCGTAVIERTTPFAITLWRHCVSSQLGSPGILAEWAIDGRDRSALRSGMDKLEV